MAFSAALRRAASVAAPAAIRALGSGQNCDRALLRPALLRGILSREQRAWAPVYPLAPFSSVAKKPASDAELLKVLDSEIKCALECDDHDRVEEIPEGFPFEIQDEKGMNILTLRRNYQGENIEIIVSMPSLVTGEEPDDRREVDNDGNEDDEDAENPSQSSIPLAVTINKGGGLSLEFCCTAYPDEVTIDSMSVRQDKQSEEDYIPYEGPDFNDLDENLQKAFHKYLKLRGISAVTTNFLHEYMINKDSREYLLWLKNLKQFIQK